MAMQKSCSNIHSKSSSLHSQVEQILVDYIVPDGAHKQLLLLAALSL